MGVTGKRNNLRKPVQDISQMNTMNIRRTENRTGRLIVRQDENRLRRIATDALAKRLCKLFRLCGVVFAFLELFAGRDGYKIISAV